MSNSSRQRISGQLFESGKPRLLPGQGHESDVEVVSEGRGFPGGGVIRADDQGVILRDERGRGVISGILDQFQNLNITAMVQDQRDLFFPPGSGKRHLQMLNISKLNIRYLQSNSINDKVDVDGSRPIGFQRMRNRKGKHQRHIQKDIHI